MMKIAIVGTRGVPNQYGGFEQFAEALGTRLVKKRHEVLVYNPESHLYKKIDYKGIIVVRKKELFRWIPPFSTLLYDLICLRDAIKQNPDLIFCCGYSSSLFFRLFKNPNYVPILVHMDGMEWQRQKWGWFAKVFLKWTEKLAMKWSDIQIVDHIEVQKYYQKKYGITPVHIPYGAEMDIRKSVNPPAFLKGDMEKEYFLIISRLEPENNIDMVLDSFLKSRRNELFLVVGETGTKYGRKLLKKYKSYSQIRFLGSIFEKEILDGLRVNCKAYFHGHSVGGTNPSLLDAMGASCFIFAHDNVYNRGIMGENAIYFSTKEDLLKYFQNMENILKNKEEYVKENLNLINKDYNWEKITRQYSELFKSVSL